MLVAERTMTRNYMSKKELAAQYHGSGCNCAQSVGCAFCAEAGADEKTMRAAAQTAVRLTVKRVTIKSAAVEDTPLFTFSKTVLRLTTLSRTTQTETEHLPGELSPRVTVFPSML